MLRILNQSELKSHEGPTLKQIRKKVPIKTVRNPDAMLIVLIFRSRDLSPPILRPIVSNSEKSVLIKIVYHPLALANE